MAPATHPTPISCRMFATPTHATRRAQTIPPNQGLLPIRSCDLPIFPAIFSIRVVQVSRQGSHGGCGVALFEAQHENADHKSHQPQMTSTWDLVQKLLDQPASSASEATAPASQTSLLDTDDKLAEALAKASDTKKRQQTQVNPNDPHPHKRPRRTYTDQEKEPVFRADARGGRRERLGATRTADNLCARAHQGRPQPTTAGMTALSRTGLSSAPSGRSSLSRSGTTTRH